MITEIKGLPTVQRVTLAVMLVLPSGVGLSWALLLATGHEPSNETARTWLLVCFAVWVFLCLVVTCTAFRWSKKATLVAMITAFMLLQILAAGVLIGIVHLAKYGLAGIQ